MLAVVKSELIYIKDNYLLTYALNRVYDSENVPLRMDMNDINIYICMKKNLRQVRSST